MSATTIWGWVIPYEYEGVEHSYEPDFLVRVSPGRTIVLEVKGFVDNQTRAKHDAAERWITAVNNWGELGRWEFLVIRDPAQLVVRLFT